MKTRSLISAPVFLLYVTMGTTAFAMGGKAASEQNASSPETVWVARPDGAQLCSTKKGQTVEAGADDLKRAGVIIQDSRKGSDGKMHAQMCGLPSGATNAYLIPKGELGKAEALGFKALP